MHQPPPALGRRLERVLRADQPGRGDPPRRSGGRLPAQDFATRDRYRKAVEKIARGSDADELEVARRGRRAGARPGRAGSRRRARRLLPGRSRAGRRSRPRSATGPICASGSSTGSWLTLGLTYFGSIAAVSALLAGVLWPGLAAAGAAGVGLAGRWSCWPLLLPVSELAVGLVNHLLTLLLPPRVLPKLDFKEGIPAELRHVRRHADACWSGRAAPRSCSSGWRSTTCQPRPAAPLRPADRLRRRARGAPCPRTRATSGDALERRPGAQRAVRRRTGPTASSSSTAAGSGTRSQGCWMGWERKRGKLSEFNRLLRGDRDTSYAVVQRRPGDAAADPLRDHARRRHPAAARHGAAGWSARWPTRSTGRGSTRRTGGWSRATASCSRGSAST